MNFGYLYVILYKMSALSFLSSLNWVDFFCLLILARVLYVSTKFGFVNEFFKLLGVFFSLTLSVQFTPEVAGFISSRTPLPQKSGETFVFLIIAVLVLFIFRLIRAGFSLIFRVETISFLNKSGSFILGLSRAILASCLLITFFSLSSIDYFRVSSSESYFYPYLINISRHAYNGFYGVLNKFSPDLKKNEALEVR